MKFEKEILRDYEDVLMRVRYLIKIKNANLEKQRIEPEDVVSEGMMVIQTLDKYDISYWKSACSKILDREVAQNPTREFNDIYDYSLSKPTSKHPVEQEQKQCKMCLNIFPVTFFKRERLLCKTCYPNYIKINPSPSQDSKSMCDGYIRMLLRHKARRHKVKFSEPSKTEIENYRLELIRKRKNERKSKTLEIRRLYNKKSYKKRKIEKLIPLLRQIKYNGVLTKYYIKNDSSLYYQDNKGEFIKKKSMKTRGKYRLYFLTISPNKVKSFYVHRLVYEYFVGDVPYGFIVYHRDGDKKNNHVDNLSLSTLSERQFQRHQRNGTYVGIGTMASVQDYVGAPKGKFHGKFKGYYIVNGKKFESSYDAESSTGIHRKVISRRCKRNFNGFMFEPMVYS